jgi:hypothetical protein
METMQLNGMTRQLLLNCTVSGHEMVRLGSLVSAAGATGHSLQSDHVVTEVMGRHILK